MSDSLPILAATADRLFSDLADSALSFEACWRRIDDAGFPQLLVAESLGGFGGDWQDAFAVLRLAGFHALRAPLADALAASWVAALSGLGQTEGLSVIAETATADWRRDRFTGTVSGVPWGRHSAHIFARVGDGLVRLAVADAIAIEERANPACEPRDLLRFEGAPAEPAATPVDSLAWGALARVAQISGALDAALGLSIAYANERSQFGRPIAKLQAVQQALAEFAEEAAAVNCAGQAAACAADLNDAGLEIAAAKIRAGQAAAIGIRVAHQTHGAIGFTREHGLHLLTSRLASWRSEFGNERFWSLNLGRWAAEHGADLFWHRLVERSDRA